MAFGALFSLSSLLFYRSNRKLIRSLQERVSQLETATNHLQNQNAHMALSCLLQSCDNYHMNILRNHRKHVYQQLSTLALDKHLKTRKDVMQKRVSEYHEFIRPLPLEYRGELMFSQSELEKLFLS